MEGIYSMEGELCSFLKLFPYARNTSNIDIATSCTAQQIISSIKVILGEDGSSRGAQKLARIRENSNFFRSELQKMGFEVLGDNDSPVAVVTAAFPATPLLLARARICISAAHTREDLIKALEELIEFLKHTRLAHLYATSISPPAAQQIISSIKVILGEDGSSRGAQKLARIQENSNFFRSELQKMGFEVLGDNDSPVMPIMLYNPANIPVRECLKRNVSFFVFASPSTLLFIFILMNDPLTVFDCLLRGPPFGSETDSNSFSCALRAAPFSPAAEQVPKYCPFCKHVGHQASDCYTKGNAPKPSLRKSAGLSKQYTADPSLKRSHNKGKNATLANEHDVLDKMPK
ncbi:Long chain base biosynthesis protein 2d [Sesamum alatum]|uniref:Long chain base biosynthesis protein 2d n=1 Tax=Sesamum alatum TaxID=300844 RepID=A0AAE1YUM9_9LAMI|nr:Long chain base biosynthesis protein 2d [Sesamum alatum]